MSVRTRARHRMRPVRSPLQYLDHEHTFTPGMAKREGPGPFAAAPIMQGAWDGSGTPDSARFSRGAGVVAPTWYANFDQTQGSIVFWVTPEWDGDDGLVHALSPWATNWMSLDKTAAGLLGLRIANITGPLHSVDVSAWTAGTTYCIVARWDATNTLDGANRISISIDDVHSFGRDANLPFLGQPATPAYIGSTQIPVNSANAIIEGLTIYRRVLWDGAYGTDVGNGDELAAIYAAGAGADPTLTTGSWDVVFAMPTDSSTGALVTGAGEAWSHPHSSAVLDDSWMETTYGASAWGTEGTPSAGPADIAVAANQLFGAGGYQITVDAADEGITQTLAGLDAGENYVVRAVVHSDGTVHPRITIHDETNGADIVVFDGPTYTGTHTGANGSATLTDATGHFPQSLMGATINNTADGSSGTITAISGDGLTITAALAGGGDDDWDTGDTFTITWDLAIRHPWAETFCFELPTIARNGVGADCVSISVKVLSANNAGTLYVHQCEVQENLIDNPSLETGAGNPWIPDGWVNQGLDPGDAQASTAGAGIIHSGRECIEFLGGAVIGEGLYVDAGVAGGQFYMLGTWAYASSGQLRIGAWASSRGLLQNSTTLFSYLSTAAAAWSDTRAIFRSVFNNLRPLIKAETAGVGYADDAYLVALDDVALTVTPASEANSLESGGIRVDGYDALTQPVLNRLKARSGHIVWRGRLRHVPANLVAFWEGAEVTLLDAFGAAANYARVRATVLNTVDTRFDDGGGAQTVNWAAAGAWAADDELFLELYWRGHFMQLSVAGIPVATINQPVNFAVLPTILYWGLLNSGGTNIDTVIKEP
ncbi:hypothetical protein LCGC14_0275440 [marine sediment metagenome]|uniref:Uncharacterized protein n=1 Tax=marine sediment metagenome TaxID=412755 RepID=A0A0F9U2D7_9ZZZZ